MENSSEPQTFKTCKYCPEGKVPQKTLTKNEIYGVCIKCQKIHQSNVLPSSFREEGQVFSALTHWDMLCEEENTFERRLLRKKIENLNYKEIMPCQMKALPPALAGKNILLVERAGKGKTMVYALPAIQKVLSEIKNHPNNHSNKCNVIIFVPTESLAEQVKRILLENMKCGEVEEGFEDYRTQLRVMSAAFDHKMPYVRDGVIVRHDLSLRQKKRWRQDFLEEKPHILITNPYTYCQIWPKNEQLGDLLDPKLIVMDEIDELLYFSKSDDYMEAIEEDEYNQEAYDVDKNLSMKIMRGFIRNLFHMQQVQASQSPQFILCSATLSYLTDNAGQNLRKAWGKGIITDVEKLFDGDVGIFSSKNIDSQVDESSDSHPQKRIKFFEIIPNIKEQIPSNVKHCFIDMNQYYRIFKVIDNEKVQVGRYKTNERECRQMLLVLAQAFPNQSIFVFCKDQKQHDIVWQRLIQPGLVEQSVMNRFTQYTWDFQEMINNKEHPILVTTDHNARGLDITEATIVINMTMVEPRKYIQRAGRVGRGENSHGIAITLVSKPTSREAENQLDVEHMVSGTRNGQHEGFLSDLYGIDQKNRNKYWLDWFLHRESSDGVGWRKWGWFEVDGMGDFGSIAFMNQIHQKYVNMLESFGKYLQEQGVNGISPQIQNEFFLNLQRQKGKVRRIELLPFSEYSENLTGVERPDASREKEREEILETRRRLEKHFANFKGRVNKIADDVEYISGRVIEEGRIAHKLNYLKLNEDTDIMEKYFKLARERARELALEKRTGDELSSIP